MKDDLSDIFIYFKESQENNAFFIEGSLGVNEQELKNLVSGSLNMEGISAFKKTPLVTLIDRVISKIKKNYSSDSMQIIIKLIAYILLSLADPSFIVSGKRLKIINGELFSNIESMFKHDKFGRKYIILNALPNDINTNGINELFSYLINEGLLQKEEEKYFINDEFFLMGVKIKS